ncbi:MAG: hypothetical protein Q9157_006162 [Trypethelium eluteriae]
MGKPPRDRLRPSLPTTQTLSDTPSTSSDQAYPTDGNAPIRSSGSAGNALAIGPFSSVTALPAAWDTADVNSYDHRLSLGALEPGLFSDLPPALSSLDFDECALIDHLDGSLLSTGLQLEPVSTPGSPSLTSYSSTPTTQPTAAPSLAGQSPPPDNASIPPVGLRGHDCPREAYEILGSLSFQISEVQSIPSSGTASTSNAVPLDHVLRLNREVSERLDRLLTCSCARTPHLALLYASIISRVLIWYQQAAGSLQSSPGSPTTATSTSCTDHARTPAASTQSTSIAVIPAKMAIGTFNVDDLRVQTALKIQLLSGEMKRAGRLIDQFSSHQFAGLSLTNGSTFGGVDSLSQSLDSWLRSEHFRIAYMMRSRLGELNT